MAANQQDFACQVEGERGHWLADYCMALHSTDDEIIASDCISNESSRSFESDCDGVVYYKGRLCELAIRRGHRLDAVEQCLADPAFAGPTVRHGGIGG